MNNEFKKHGYQTMFQEDNCWHDSWGIVLNNLLRSNGAANEKTLVVIFVFQIARSLYNS